MWKKEQSQRILLRTCREIVYSVVPFDEKKKREKEMSRVYIVRMSLTVSTSPSTQHRNACLYYYICTHSRTFSLNENVERRGTEVYEGCFKAKT